MKAKTALKAKSGLKAKSVLKARAVPKKQKKPTISKMKKKADAEFSKATRLRFAHKKDGEFWARCVTCGVEKSIKQLQCGHFMSRQYNSTRYEEENCAPQCYGCNVMQQGRQFEFAEWVDSFYGVGTAKKLLKMSKVSRQFTVEELEQIISDSRGVIDFYEKQ